MKTIVTFVAIASLTGCASQMNVGSDHATLTGTPEGIRSMFDGMNGLISGGKASPDKMSGYQRARMDQEKEISKRSMAPSFLSSLLNRNNASNVTNVDTSTPATLE